MNELLEIAKQAALEAGAEIMKIYTDPAQDFGVEKNPTTVLLPWQIKQRICVSCVIWMKRASPF